MVIGIIDYSAGNAPSVLCAVRHLGYEGELLHSPENLEGKTHIILPGVGSAGATMLSLRNMNMIQALEQAVLSGKVLFLGVCVGMQVLFEHSEEDNADCLGWFKGKVVMFDKKSLRVPQMGWNNVRFVKDTQCNVKEDYFYFVNSYYAKPENEHDIWALADYGGDFTAAVCRDNIYGAQFHVEKSGEAGLGLLQKFIDLKKV